MRLAFAPLILTSCALLACGRPVDAPPAAAGDTLSADGLSADGGVCMSQVCGLPPPTTVITGHLLECYWQAVVTFVWRGREYLLDVWLFLPQTQADRAQACRSDPFTSRALLDAVTCKGGLSCAPLTLGKDLFGKDLYRLEGAYESVEVCRPTSKGAPPSCAPGQVFIPTGVTLAAP